MVAKEPQHANFFARTQLATAMRLVTPAAISMAITGVLMIGVRGWTDDRRHAQWLTVAIVLYVDRDRVLGRRPGAGRAEDGGTHRDAARARDPAAAGAPRDREALRLGGMFLSVLVVIIVFLMVVKPF